MSRFRKALVLCVDQPYLPFALFLMRQIDYHEPEREFDFVLMSDSPLTIPSAFDGLKIKVLPPLESEAYGKQKITHLARSAYLRLWAAEALAGIYDRILYLDSDMFADGGGFSRLMDTDMQGCAIAAVRDVQQWYRPHRDVEEFRRAGRKGRRYFNSGLLLIDVARYQADGVLNKALEIASRHPEWVRHHDQSLLNLAVDGNWVELSPVWNWQWPIKYQLFGDWCGVRLNHFIGWYKPWMDRDGLCAARFVLNYESFLSRHFPETLYAPPEKPSLLYGGKRYWKMVLRFFALRGKLLNYLKEFPDPFTVRVNRPRETSSS
ncbi:glycosyltransferase family 8 protein [Falsigemmobacter intermedius]|uniref:Glycosyltransferase family 8 protein n=1 Tax=Falsigemmobacter intermedius TaxID=1553448 RepID=A0A451GGA0_9RHOB|nr:glycosyltransferase family 8 protein [Falsigemmobacter intermedius]RWY34939.1 glycosyltransferase family 8 protein [Falsigemmobacter intermedius]